MEKALPPERRTPIIHVPDGHFISGHNGALNNDLISHGLIPVKLKPPSNLGELADWLDWMMPKRPLETIKFLRLLHRNRTVDFPRIHKEVGADPIYLLKKAREFIEAHPMPIVLKQYGDIIEREDRSE
jgi:hypothetical protein